MLRATRIICGLLCIVLSFAWSSTWEYFFAHRPPIPDTATGRTYSLLNHGSVVYLTSGEYLFLWGMAGGAFACGIISCIAYFIETRK